VGNPPFKRSVGSAVMSYPAIAACLLIGFIFQLCNQALGHSPFSGECALGLAMFWLGYTVNRVDGKR
jgi:hypothetical protein